MNIGKKLLPIALCLMLVFGTLAVGTGGFAELFDSISIKASATYSVGDTIYYGTYPQTDVTSSLGSVLNSQSGTWKSYGYYSGTDQWDDGQMTASDYMRYKDVTYNGAKYRGVTFDSYRPIGTGFTSEHNGQQGNGYYTGTTYWFKYEPLKWRILDPSTGLVMCETIIDSQPYNNYILYADNEYWGDSTKTYYANNYAKSSIRQWLNNDFYNTAFSDEQKLNIKATTLNNDGYYTLTGTTGYEKYDAPSTNDKIFLLTYNEVLNISYGFSTSYSTYDSSRQAKGSDYAKCQGLEVFNSSGSSYDGCSSWRLCSPGYRSYWACSVASDGNVNYLYGTDHTIYGVRPALKLQNLKSDYAGSEIDDPEYTAVFISDGKTISEKKYKEGEIIQKPVNPSKNGYSFKTWTPAVPAKMPAKDMTFTAEFEKITEPANPTASAKLNAKSSTTVDYRSKVNITATASGVPDGYFLAIYSGNTLLEKGTKDKVTYTPKDSNNKSLELKSDVTYTVKVIDGKNAVQKDSNGKDLTANVEVKVKQGFFDKLIAFFKGLFGLLPTVEIKP